jgi:hypothetical protein
VNHNSHTGMLSQREYVRLKCSEKWRTGDLLLQENVPERSALSVQKFLAMKHASRPQPSALPIRGAALLSLFPTLKVIFMRRRFYDIVKENLQITYLDRQIQGSVCSRRLKYRKKPQYTSSCCFTERLVTWNSGYEAWREAGNFRLKNEPNRIFFANNPCLVS